MSTIRKSSPPKASAIPNENKQELDKVPIILRDADEQKTHYIFARRPKKEEPEYNVLLSFETKQGVAIKHRVPIKHDTLIRDITVSGRFIISNDTSDYEKNPEKVGELIMKEHIQKELGKEGRPHKTKNFRPKPSRLGASGRLSTSHVGGGKFKLSTRKCNCKSKPI